jgi:hypothetical protein
MMFESSSEHLTQVFQKEHEKPKLRARGKEASLIWHPFPEVRMCNPAPGLFNQKLASSAGVSTAVLGQ